MQQTKILMVIYHKVHIGKYINNPTRLFGIDDYLFN